MSDLDKVYVSTAGLQRELGIANVTARSILAETEGDTLTFDGRTLYNRAAVAEVLRERNAKLLGFLSALEV